MLTRLRRSSVAVAAFALGTLALTGAASSVGYPPNGSCVTDAAVVSASASIEFSCAPSSFGASEPVTVTVTGHNGTDATIAFIRPTVSTITADRVSTAEGALDPVQITLPNDARGTYTIAAFSPSSAGGTAAVTVESGAGGIAGLPGTGGDPSQTLALWAIGGTLVIAGVTFGTVAFVRRRTAID